MRRISKMVKVFPSGYDPIIAAGPPTDLHNMLRFAWSKEDTERHRSLEKNAVIQEKPPIGRWYEPLPSDTKSPITQRGI
jgi:hypothetical protein